MTIGTEALWDGIVTPRSPAQDWLQIRTYKVHPGSMLDQAQGQNPLTHGVDDGICTQVPEAERKVVIRDSSVARRRSQRLPLQVLCQVMLDFSLPFAVECAC